MCVFPPHVIVVSPPFLLFRLYYSSDFGSVFLRRELSVRETVADGGERVMGGWLPGCLGRKRITGCFEHG